MKTASGMQRKVCGAERPRHINWIGERAPRNTAMRPRSNSFSISIAEPQ